ncbi:TEL2-interacting protein 1 [Clydaea vesicula]|uniref:TEL2-interacting protein 1 n=1 Tax=Clydaea vesicula TaxID=447962 RepID=A0AAD5XXB3_9FUNG|nr:TEL2-interacting protein 1 [Clydaea vesicula]
MFNNQNPDVKYYVLISQLLDVIENPQTEQNVLVNSFKTISSMLALTSDLKPIIPGLLSKLTKYIAKNIRKHNSHVTIPLKVIVNSIKQVYSEKNNEDFKKKTTSHIGDVIKVVQSNLINHSNFKCRLGLLHFSYTLIKDCKMYVRENLKPIILFQNDEYKEVQGLANVLMKSLQKDMTSTSIIDMLKKNFFELYNILPNLLRKKQENSIQENLRLLNGYVFLLRSEISSTFISGLSDFSASVMSLLQFETSDVKFVQEKSSGIDFKFEHVLTEKYRIKSLTASTINILRTTLQLIFTYTNQLQVLFHFLDLANSADENLVLPALFCINEFCLPPPTFEEGFEKTWYSGFVVEEFVSQLKVDNIFNIREEKVLDLRVFKVMIEDYCSLLSQFRPTNKFEAKLESNLNKFNLEITRVELLLIGLGNISRRMGVQFEPYLVIVLYPVLAKLSSSSKILADRAAKTLFQISSALGTSIENLCFGNMDYVTNKLLINFRNLKANPQSLFVLNSLLNVLEKEHISYCFELIESCLDFEELELDDKEILPLFEVFFKFSKIVSEIQVIEIAKPDKKKSDNKVSKELIELELERSFEEDAKIFEIDETVTFKEAEAFFKNRNEVGKPLNEMDDEEEKKDIPSNSEKIDPEPVLPTKLETLTQKLLATLSNYISCDSQKLRLLCIKAINNLIFGVKKEERVTSINKIWHLIVLRLDQDSSDLVKIEAVNFVYNIFTTEKEFMKKKIYDEIFEKFFGTFEKYSKEFNSDNIYQVYQSSKSNTYYQSKKMNLDDFSNYKNKNIYYKHFIKLIDYLILNLNLNKKELFWFNKRFFQVFKNFNFESSSNSSRKIEYFGDLLENLCSIDKNSCWFFLFCFQQNYGPHALQKQQNESVFENLSIPQPYIEKNLKFDQTEYEHFMNLVEL